MELNADRKGAGMNCPVSAGAAHTIPWGAAPGCYERCAYGAGAA
jgi:hypothetical protein